MSKNRFYVYIYFKLNGTPCYVGKGMGNRFKVHLTRTHNPRLASEITKAGGLLPVVIVRAGLTDEEAQETERAFIRASD